MTLIMYERIGHEGRRPSPFSWRVRYALAHKGVEPQFRHVRFADVETVRALSGQHFVPIITDGDRVIHDSWNITCYLEERFPDRPSLFAGSGERAVTRLVNHWADQTLGTAVRRLRISSCALMPTIAPITDARGRPLSVAHSKSIAPIGRAGLPNSTP
jgi:glutathione S-transferase